MYTAPTSINAIQCSFPHSSYFTPTGLSFPFSYAKNPDRSAILSISVKCQVYPRPSYPKLFRPMAQNSEVLSWFSVTKIENLLPAAIFVTFLPYRVSMSTGVQATLAGAFPMRIEMLPSYRMLFRPHTMTELSSIRAIV